MTGPREKSPGVHLPPPLVFVIGLGGGWLLQRLLPLPIVPPARIELMRSGAVILFLCGTALAASALLAFRHARTSPLPMRPASALITTGVYRFTRNPMYLSLGCLTAGAGFLANSLWMLASVIPVLAVIRHAVIAREEAYLIERFPDAYREYCARVRRWL